MKYSIFICLFSIISLICSQSQNCVKKLSQDQINVILDAHNTYRNKVASGNQSSAGGQLPSASNMKVLEWSTELEDFAQGWAELNNTFSNPMNNGRFGENMFWSWTFHSEIQEPGNYPVQRAVDLWFKEVDSFKQPIERYLNRGPKSIGHFAQIIWAETTKIGCGILDCMSSEKSVSKNMYTETTIVVCNYSSRGNLFFSPIFKKGVPCSSCVCSKKYTSLCN